MCRYKYMLAHMDEALDKYLISRRREMASA